MAIRHDTSEEFDPLWGPFIYDGSLDKIASELQDTCHRQSERISYLEATLLECNIDISDASYNEWRKREAYQIPVTEEGARKSNGKIY